MNKITSIYQYPVKGFSGEKLSSVRLRKNKGLPEDRKYALSSGQIKVNENGFWSPSQAFQRMKIRPDLSMFKLERDEDKLQLITPLGKALRIEAGGESSELLSETFGNNTTIHRTTSGQGYWDHKDASISIINISTVEEISRRLGQVIDPLRFRANLYIRSEPWSEFNWLGKKLLIENCELNIIRPIDRCSSTSVDLNTGKNDLNMPALLSRYFGHLFCGVYATVSNGGEIKINNKIRIGSNMNDSELTASIFQTASSKSSNWPRQITVKKIIHETEDICSIWMNDPFMKLGTFSAYKPGQYIHLHGLSNSNVWRCYTVSKIKEDSFRITVKRDNGLGSQAIHNLLPDEKVQMSGPFGNVTIRQSSNSIFLLSAGIGITASVSKLQGLIDMSYDKSIQLIHVARTKRDLALWDEVIKLSEQLPHIKVSLYLTKEKHSTSTFVAGRPNLQAISREIKLAGSDLHICGSEQFTKDISNMFNDKSRLFVDTFFTPVTENKFREIKKCDPIKVTLARSNVTKYWKPEDGTLLEFAEANGAIISSHCRAGICSTCTCNIISGSTAKIIGTKSINRNNTLLCSSVPNETVVLDI
ncbi:MOSC domain-containing protein [Colwellia psychrerythraea]|uniref:Oxidoreductase, FAD-binding/iron-sulfur cluster binding protein n=1 Tax=Colwellia psychrerythraea (strain 34H / ATCC BAA-681) TaxID=167879 RepID=Q483K3_COLP3|nr:2Fe-2S iron-sulfur cluster-binding protein [Colwellia psychrerythraea]AAZ27272.1 oxidoreductase, FAD-binding/iron-sulfur cluster binding protein [Colwellia psychrerythraea 34H]